MLHTARASALLLALLSLPAAAADGPGFENVAAPAGVAGVPVTRLRFADLDGDGWPDVLLDSPRVFLNREKKDGPGGRAFADATAESRLPALWTAGEKVISPSVVVAGDADNDGDLDLFAGRYCEPEKPETDKQTNLPKRDGDRLALAWKDPGLRNAILLNDGKARFDLLADSGLAEPAETTCAAVWVDVDSDGVLDLFVGNWYVEYGISNDSYPDRLFRGLGAGRFAEITSRAGMMTVRNAGYRNSSRPTYGVSHCDWNNDGRQDLLVCAYGRQWNMLWRNNGDGTFTEMGAETGFDGDEDRSGTYPQGVNRPKEPPFRSNGNTFAAACGDFDNDGDLDVFLAEICHWWAGPSSDRSSLLVNLGGEAGWKFARKREELGIVRTRADPRQWNEGDLHASFFDYDNDGLLDLLLASSDYPDDQFLRIFRQAEPNRFEDVTASAGIQWRNPSGVSIADFDRDGREDILAGTTDMRLTAEQRKERALEAALFRNVSAPENHFLTVRLAGKGAGGSNRQGIGARIEVVAGGKTQMREIYGGGGLGGHQNEPVAHFGLGSAAKVDVLRVRWPDKACTVQEFRGVDADAFLVIREGSATPEAERRVPRPLKKEAQEEGF
jgi:hypothetical protein